MATYTVTNRTTGESWEVEAESYEAAATLAVEQHIDGKARARRVTGDKGKSGMFQGYKPIGHEGGLTSVGPNLHVM